MASNYSSDYRKKKRAKQERDSPFPVPIASITQSPCDENYWYHFTGQLQNNSVIVTHSGDIRCLYKMGFFGRGMLSRGGPEFHQSAPYVYLTSETGSEPNIVDVMKRRMYLRHRQWQQLADQDNKNDPDQITLEDLEFDSDIEYHQDENLQDESVYRENTDTYVGDNNFERCGNNALDDSQLASQNSSSQINAKRSCNSWDDSEGDAAFWTSEASEYNNLQDDHAISEQLATNSLRNRQDRTCDLWENSEGDAAFWTSEIKCTDNNSQDKHVAYEQGDIKVNCDNYFKDTSEKNVVTDWKSDFKDTNKKNVVTDWDNSEADEDFWDTPSLTLATDSASHNDLDKSDLDKLHQGEKGQTLSDESDQPVAKKRKTEDNLISVIDDFVTRTKGNIKGDLTLLNDSCNGEESIIIQNSLDNCSDLSALPSKSGIDNHPNIISHMKSGGENSHGQGDSVNTEAIKSDNILDSEMVDITESHSKNTDINNSPIASDTNIEESMTSVQTEDESHVNLRVIATTHTESNDKHHKEMDDYEMVKTHPYCKSNDQDADYLVIDDFDQGHMTSRSCQWQPVMKKDPFPYTEPLILTAEEAFFLSYGLGCLTVNDENQNEPLTLKELWVTFCQQRRFLPCYAAYHFFRSRGWVPKPGILFGTDFLLYKEGPPFFHGSHSVVVRAVHSGTYKPVDKYSNRTLSWTSFSGLQRITEHVAKTLLVCYVIMPSDLTEEDKSSPNCLSRFKIHLQKYSRWVSSQEREAEKVTDMP